MADDKSATKTIKEANSKPFSKAIGDAMRSSNAIQAAIDASNTIGKLSAIDDAFRHSGIIQGAIGDLSKSSDAMNFAKGIPDAAMQDAIKGAYLHPSETLQAAMGALSSVSATENIARGIVGAALREVPIAQTTVRAPTIEGKRIHSISDIGMAVRNARKARNLTQQDFADLAGVGRRFLSELESGKPTLEIGKVLTVAKAAGIQLMLVSNIDE
ncbi:MAG: helix-turn-helix transcriptional regulator [Rhizobiaceae bacterium]